MTHNKQEYVSKCVHLDMPILLTGPAGSGKTTIVINLANEHSKQLYSIAGTKQTTVNALLGFISIDGTYIPTQFRKAFEEGHYFLIDEINAMDPNVLLSLNTIENNFISFPDKRVQRHPDFRLFATANPEDSTYTARSKMDFSSKDRFHEIQIPRDHDLEVSLTSPETEEMVDIAREILSTNGTSLQLTMRDAIRIDKLRKSGISDAPLYDVVFWRDEHLHKEFTTKYQSFLTEKRKKEVGQAAASSINELWEMVNPTDVDIPF